MRRNVLITAASRRVALVKAFQRALRRPGISGKVLVTDVNPLSPAVHMADRAFRVPYADEPDYLDEIHAAQRSLPDSTHEQHAQAGCPSVPPERRKCAVFRIQLSQNVVDELRHQ